MEMDHIIPLSRGGKDEYKNLQLLHRHCHDTKTALDSLLLKTDHKGLNESSTITSSLP